ncbi:Hsp70 family protein [Candidatus Laterigemmans baculatus]|uniref:Hsp70 family protein n=1 Tax=Candidatus Laterigemmans baculatus TaxID=2770505 RepID=UPI0013DB7FD1|nr:Hsp70 family protein [Candidatus Laterigemmans baculatus]
MTARYSIGIDLGTTNSVVAYTPLEGDAPELHLLPIPQIVGPGEVESHHSLPSFLYLLEEGEAASAALPWDTETPRYVVGEWARTKSAQVPQRVVAAAKSWLCHSRVDRRDAILPWQAPPEVPKISPIAVTEAYLRHLAAAWNQAMDDAPLADQTVVLTVPASFDPAARELTREAAISAGFPADFVLLEEPQAAVYRWLEGRGDQWRRELKAGDSLLVVDVGGGTTDLTMVRLVDHGGNVELERQAVGNHLLVGGDNMDLALAHMVAGKLAEEGHNLDPWQNIALWHSCRAAKERLLAPEGAPQQTISVLGRGSRLIGGTITTELDREAVAGLLLGGFFPRCSLDARPERQSVSGFQDIGLPYESDPAVTRHIAAFLSSHRRDGSALPTHLLFNGGVFRSPALRESVVGTFAEWAGDAPPTMLGGPEDLDHAVALGAAYYGWSKLRGGLRIHGGTARSYYIGIETAGLAIPGAPRPLRALCVAPLGMEEGTEVDVPSQEVGVVIGRPARFRFFSSTVRRDDSPGDRLDRWDPSELVESDTIEATLDSGSAGDDPFLPVRFQSRVTELGMFELYCHSTRSDDRWKMEFNAREEGAA